MTSTELAERMAGARVAQQEGQGKTLHEQLEDPRFKTQLERALGKAIPVERYLRLVLTEVRKNPELLRCSPQSVLGAVMTGAQLALEPDVRGLAYLIPRWNNKTKTKECTFLIGYRGYLDLARRAGLSVQAEVVCENDEFTFEYGTHARIRHVPRLTGERGEVVAAYAIATDGAFMVLRRDEIEKRRGRAQAGDKGPWVSDWEAMARKTAVRALSSYLPQTVELAQAAALDETVRTDIKSSLEDVVPQRDDVDDAEVVEDGGSPGTGDPGAEQSVEGTGRAVDADAETEPGLEPVATGASFGDPTSLPPQSDAGESDHREASAAGTAVPSSPASQSDGDPGEPGPGAEPAAGPTGEAEPPPPSAPSVSPGLHRDIEKLTREQLVAEAKKYGVLARGTDAAIRARLIAKLEEPFE